MEAAPLPPFFNLWIVIIFTSNPLSSAQGIEAEILFLRSEATQIKIGAESPVPPLGRDAPIEFALNGAGILIHKEPEAVYMPVAVPPKRTGENWEYDASSNLR